MKNVIYGFIIALLLWLLPVIPYENDMGDGVMVLENRSVVEWVIDKYDSIQPGKE